MRKQKRYAKRSGATPISQKRRRNIYCKMILTDVEIFNHQREEFETFESLVDTGSTYCVIEQSIAETLGLKPLDILHLWQMGDPLNVPKTNLKARYGGAEYPIEGLIIEIKESYKRPIIEGERCTRPEASHPLTNRIVVGKSLLDKIPDEEYKEIFAQKI